MELLHAELHLRSVESELLGAERHLREVELELFDRELHLGSVELELFDWELHLGLVESGLLCAELHLGLVELELLAAELRLMALSRSCLPHKYAYGCQAGVIVTITSLSSPAHASQPQKKPHHECHPLFRPVQEESAPQSSTKLI